MAPSRHIRFSTEKIKMRIFNSLEEINNIESTAVALGSFDGVHLGHQELIRRTVNAAKEKGLKSGVFTFSNHPKNVISGENSVKNILYKNEKEEIIESLGVDYLFDVPFTKEVMTLPKDRYISELLLDRCKAKLIACGFNHRFGFKAEGDTDYIERLGEELGFETIVMEPFKVDGNVVSSTLIRTQIASGRVDRCMSYMGRYYSIRGEVVVGNKLGKKIGFPTSNLMIDLSMVTPPNGVYVTYCTYNGRRYPSVTNVGIKPTITQDGQGDSGKRVKNVETHIFDFDSELYGKTITVEFLRKLRDEVKFDDINELSEQIVRDCREARKYHEEKYI